MDPTKEYELAPPGSLVRLKGPNEHPLFPHAVYCAPELWNSCISQPGRDHKLHENDRTDALLSSMAAAINKAMATTRGDFSRITFKHWYRSKRAKATKKTQARVDAILRYFPHTHQPWLLLSHEGWLPEAMH